MSSELFPIFFSIDGPSCNGGATCASSQCGISDAVDGNFFPRMQRRPADLADRHVFGSDMLLVDDTFVE
jgi:hypothetical protein